MSFEYAIEVKSLSKCYQIYDKPSDRLKQMLLRGRRQYYKEFWALNDVSFKIKKGETVGIIGRNGSGKSTLLQMICGTLNPTAGDIKVQGRVAALLELGSGFNPEFTGRENVFFNAGVLGQSEAITRRKFSAIESFADISDFIDQPVKTYSSGMMVRLAFAVIAHVDADILVIDEALAVGDAFFTQKCMRFLREFMQNGTVLFVSHDTAAVKGLCTRAIWLDKGLVKQRGEPKYVCEQYLQAYYESQQSDQESDAGENRSKAHQVNIDSLLAKHAAIDKPARIDQRLPFLNASNLRNDLRLFEFNPDAPSFGQGGSRVISVALCNTDGQPMSWAVGGEDVELLIEAVALQELHSPIVGFVVKDRLGQTLFGDNTFVAYEHNGCACKAGQLLRTRFQFQMPRLPVGDYSITIAIAEGTQEEHVQHQWIFDAVTFRSESTSISAGLIGIPMQNVFMNVR
ncbi:MAG: ABC transporter ATP-binding protein [Hydrogenophaga sp.]|uniref:ABC transporter ATP-binding protein n=1 Tax=Hydrogenophaga sp. TaxID=1904254 RepID=UPI00275E14E6|nr:ABC transporter ATP-binding protein [Hydrogenophaga sp.]MDP2416909.1 ABC transporter ATP-binding protein [Hydrogenophaga sp.]MDZ4188924.1 ABC transporter ATP-binding protein [Hydrogenophaga sp.]